LQQRSSRPLLADEMKDFWDQVRGHDHERLTLFGQRRFDLGGLFPFGLSIVVGGQVTDAFLGPSVWKALFFHRFFLRFARRIWGRPGTAAPLYHPSPVHSPPRLGSEAWSLQRFLLMRLK